MAGENYLMVAAIDFGTTFSGYAFSFKSNKENILMNKNWGAGVGFQSYKTPTCVLVNPDEEFESFGYEAESKYGEIFEDGTESNGWAIFRHFKMALHKTSQQGKISRHHKLASSTGSLIPAMDIFAMALRYLKKHLIEAVGQQTERPPSDKMIRWVITVPAIWSDESKQFMREAAYKAGFMPTVDSTQLVIALEPEAASLYCRRLEVKQFMDRQKSISFHPGTKYLVIDSGGGTVDVTAHEILRNETVKELDAATGGAWGGTKVDENFIHLLSEALGRKFVTEYQNTCPQQWLQLMINFEKVKRAAKPNGRSTINLQLSWDMGQKYAEVMNGKQIVAAIQEKGKRLGIKFSNGMLILEHKTVKSLFDPVLRNITDHIEKLLRNEKLQPCEYFFLVGGFSESEFLQQAIRDSFESRVDILVPNEAQMSVIKGAVRFGHNPTEIRSRIARKTYGYNTSQKFNSKLHKESKKRLFDDVEYCVGLFSPFVHQGDEVTVGNVMKRIQHPVEANQEWMDITYYCFDGIPDSVEYVDDPAMQKLAHIRVEMPNLEGGRNREVEMSVKFGGTEIHISAVDKLTGNKAATKLDFFVE